MTGLALDVAFGLRSLLSRPAFAAVAITMLGFGIASNATVFTLFNAVFLRPLPFPEAHRLVDLDEQAPQWNLEYVGVSYPDFDAWRTLNTTFDSMAVFDTESYNLASDGRADRVRVALVSWELGQVLGVEPVLGRDFTASDDAEGATRVALLTHAAWRGRFAADAEVLGTTIRLDSEPYVVVGALPPTAVFPTDVDLWLPLSTLSYCCERATGLDPGG